MAYRYERAFKIKNMKSKYFGKFIIKIINLRVIEENAYEINTSHHKELVKLGFCPTVVLVCIFE